MIEVESQNRSTAGSTDQLAPVDPIVRYPSYRSFDEFIDVEELRSSVDIYERLAKTLLDR